MILEGLVTTRNADGSPHLAPMGPRVAADFARFTLRPFPTSGTYRNLLAHPEGVLHVTDDALLIARAALGAADPLPELRPAEKVAGFVLADCCRHYEFVVKSVDDSGERVTIEDGVTIHAFCHLEGAVIRSGSELGPYARTRPGADIGPDAKIGNFVEVKNTRVGKGAKANHLSYLGDGNIGEGANIGAGTIFCNYDGFAKHRTVIEPGAFVGSNSSIVAPVTIGADAYVASGSVVTRDVPADALALARARQENKEGYAAKIRAMKKSAKKA